MAAPGGFTCFTLHVDFFGGGEFGEGGAESFGAHEAAEAGAKIFAGDSGRERIGAVKLFDAGEDFFAGVFVESGGDEEKWVGYVFGAVGGDEFLRGGLDFCVEPAGAGGDFGLSDAGAGAVDHCGENFGAVAAFDGFEERGATCVFGGGAAGLRVED